MPAADGSDGSSRTMHLGGGLHGRGHAGATLVCMNTCYVYVLCSRDHRHVSVRVTADLRHGVRSERRHIARKLGRKRVYQKVVLIESYSGRSAAVERAREMQCLTRSQFYRFVSKRNPMWRALSVSGYLERRQRRLRTSMAR